MSRPAARLLPTSLLAIAALLILAGCGAAASPSTPQGSVAPSALVLPSVVDVTPLPTDVESSTTPPETTPNPQEAYQALLAAIPPQVAAHCEMLKFTQSLPAEPGETAEADCTLPSGGLAGYVVYHQFADDDSMNSFFNIQRRDHERGGGVVNGPGCGKGPGEGTWDNGKKDCYEFLNNDAHVMWTNDSLYVVADAVRDSEKPTFEDWGKLEQFWQTAGPVSP